MFGFSFAKLIFTVLIVMAIWYGFKWIGRIQELRDANARNQLRRGEKPEKSSPPANNAEDMIKCPACESFVAAKGVSSCGRDDCPYPG